MISSIGGGVTTILPDCYTVLADLPSGATAKLKTLSPFINSGATVSIVGQTAENVAAVGDAMYVNVSDSGKILIRRTLDRPDDPQIGAFAIVYTGDILSFR